MTVVGEVPAESVQLIAQNVEYRAHSDRRGGRSGRRALFLETAGLCLYLPNLIRNAQPVTPNKGAHRS